MRNEIKIIKQEVDLMCYFNHNLPIINVIMERSWPENKRLRCVECPRILNKKIESIENVIQRIQDSQKHNLNLYQSLTNPIFSLLNEFNDNIQKIASDLKKKLSILNELSILVSNFKDGLKQQTLQFSSYKFTKELEKLIENEDQYQEEKYLREENQFFEKLNFWIKESNQKITKFQKYHNYFKRQQLLQKVTQMKKSLEQIYMTTLTISETLKNSQADNTIIQQFEVVAYQQQNINTNLIIEITENSFNYYNDGTFIKSENQCSMGKVCQNMVQLQKLSWKGDYDLQNNKIGIWKAFWDGLQTNIGGRYREGGVKTGKWVEMTTQYRDEMLVTFEGQYDQFGQKYGLWTYVYNEQIIGLGVYSSNGLKSGEWFEIDEQFNKQSYLMIQKGYYGQDEFKEGRWLTYFDNEIIFNGYYNCQGQKVDFWVEIYGNYDYTDKTYIQGTYNDQGNKIGFWTIFYNFKKVGGGKYNQFGKKVGQWKEVDQNFRKISYMEFDFTFEENFNYNQYIRNSNVNSINQEIYFEGKYNEEGNKIGRWVVHNMIKKIGGGCYNEQGFKQGKWREIHSQLKNHLVIMAGEYNNQGQRIHEWKIWYKNQDDKIKLGGGCYGYNGKKIQKWTELYTFYNNQDIKSKTIHYYEGQYDQKGVRIYQWIIKADNTEIGGGNYNINGFKTGYWKEVIMYCGDKQYIYQDGYYNTKGQKIGKWITYISKREIGGGYYDQQGIKYGKWYEFNETYKKQLFRGQIFLMKGYYNSGGQKKGAWDEKIRYID